MNYKILIVIMLLGFSCSHSENKKNNISYTQEQSIYNERKAILLEEMEDTCRLHKIPDINFTSFKFDIKSMDSIHFYINDSLVYIGELNNNLTPLFVKYKTSTSNVRSLAIIDTTKVNTIKLYFKNRNQYLEFKLSRYSPLLMIVENSPKWKIIYSNCIEQKDE